MVLNSAPVNNGVPSVIFGTTLMMGERIWRTAPYAKAGVMISEQPPEAVEQPAESPGALTLTGRSIPSASIWVAKVWRAQ